MDVFSFFSPKILYRTSSRFNENIEVISSFGKKSLLVNGIQQTGTYVNALFKNGIRHLASWHSGQVNRILVFGIGGGGVLFQLRNAYPSAHITAVDIDGEIVAVSKRYFGVSSVGNISFEITDARDFIKKKSEYRKYDLVVVDMYIGNDVPSFVTATPFLSGVKNLIRPAGRLMMNYFSFRNQPEHAALLLDKLSVIYQSVDRKKNLRNIFFFCQT